MRGLGLSIALAASGLGFTLLAMRWDAERSGIPRDGQELLGVFMFGVLQVLVAGFIAAVALARRGGPAMLAGVTVVGVALSAGAFVLTRELRAPSLLSFALIAGSAWGLTPRERSVAMGIGAGGATLLLLVALVRGPVPWIRGIDAPWIATLGVISAIVLSTGIPSPHAPTRSVIAAAAVSGVFGAVSAFAVRVLLLSIGDPLMQGVALAAVVALLPLPLGLVGRRAGWIGAGAFALGFVIGLVASGATSPIVEFHSLAAGGSS